MRDRKSRVDEQKQVIVKDDNQSYSCLLADMSATGISVITDHFFPTYRQVEVIMEIAGKPVSMKGNTRWSIDPGTTIERMGKLGIFIMDPPPAFLDYVDEREKK